MSLSSSTDRTSKTLKVINGLWAFFKLLNYQRPCYWILKLLGRYSTLIPLYLYNWKVVYHPESEIGQLQISVIIQAIKDTYCFGFVVYLKTSLTWPRDKLLFRFKRVHSGAGRWNLSWKMGELEFCAHNSVATADLKSNAELWLALPLCAQFFWPMRN